MRGGEFRNLGLRKRVWKVEGGFFLRMGFFKPRGDFLVLRENLNDGIKQRNSDFLKNGLADYIRV